MIAAVLSFGLGCDDKPAEKPAPQTNTAPAAPADDEITAEPAFAGMPVGAKVAATISSKSMIPTEPSEKVRKKLGQHRAVDVNTTVKTHFFGERSDAEDGPMAWKLEFDTFEKAIERVDTPTAKTSHDLPDAGFLVSLGEEPSVEAIAEKARKPTDSQEEFALAIARELATQPAWGKFLSEREFPQAKIVEVPKELKLGRFAEVFFGPIIESHMTISLFRLAMEDGNELGVFEINGRMKTQSSDDDSVFYDFELKGKMTVRIVDGHLMRYRTNARVVPRNKAGAMLPTGSGEWELRYESDPRPLEQQ